MKSAFSLLTIFSMFLSTVGYSQDTGEITVEDIDIPYEQYTLENGLNVIIHEDHKAPIVAVNVWYHVGSKNEPDGRSGFAHLFEHLMFNGSENFNDDYFQAMERVGATDMNGTTNFDRTNYFQNVPTSAFEVALFMESDRMGHFAGAISQERLDEQRGVVQNEKRQGENQPYGEFFNVVTEYCFPKGHPYDHTTIGSMDDLNAAELKDVKDWFKNYYGAANATLVIAGDVEAEKAIEKVRKFFGDVEPGPPVTQPQSNIAKRSGEVRVKMQDRVPQSRVYMIWNVPEFGNKDAFALDYSAAVLAGGKNSRLYKRLVYDDEIASSVSAFNWENELAGLFVIQVDAKPDVSTETIEKAVNEELQKFLEEGPTQAEIDRERSEWIADFVRGIERIGGFGGKSDILAQNAVYKGDPSFYKTRFEGMKGMDASTVKSVSNKWLSDGKFYLEINPYPEYKTLASGYDRSKGLPELDKAPMVEFPDVQRAELDNGLKIVLANRSTVPVVEMRMLFDAGYAADQFGKPGTAKLAMDMMDEGTDSRSSLEISEELSKLGANLNTGSNLDMSYVSFSALKSKLDRSMDLFSDVVLNPSFPESDFERLKKQQIVDIKQEKSRPQSMALRVAPRFLYGDNHAYGLPFTGSGYEETVKNIEKDDLQEFYNNWIRPNNASLVMVGDITIEEAKNIANKHFGNWKSGEVPEKKLPKVEQGDSDKIYLVDRPGSIQSVVIAGRLIEPYGDLDEIAMNTTNDILGGEFTSRVNMNLREDKGWAYGAFTFAYSAKGQRPFMAYAPVQSDKTSDSMQEIIKELTAFKGDKPATEEEFQKVKENRVLSLPGNWETNNSVEGSLTNLVRYDLSDDYYDEYPGRVRSLQLDDIHKMSDKLIDTSQLKWVVVGDREQIQQEIEKLNMGEIVVIDADGNPVEPQGSMDPPQN